MASARLKGRLGPAAAAAASGRRLLSELPKDDRLNTAVRKLPVQKYNTWNKTQVNTDSV
jgi:hypothetical protein